MVLWRPFSKFWFHLHSFCSLPLSNELRISFFPHFQSPSQLCPSLHIITFHWLLALTSAYACLYCSCVKFQALTDTISHTQETVSWEVEGLTTFWSFKILSLQCKPNKKLENNSPADMSMKFPNKLHVLFVPPDLHVPLQPTSRLCSLWVRFVCSFHSLSKKSASPWLSLLCPMMIKRVFLSGKIMNNLFEIRSLAQLLILVSSELWGIHRYLHKWLSWSLNNFKKTNNMNTVHGWRNSLFLIQNQCFQSSAHFSS